MIIKLTIPVEPIPKQSYKRGYTPEIRRWYSRLKENKKSIATYIRTVYQGPPHPGFIYFHKLFFYVKNIESSDVDNLQKGFFDAIQGILIENDKRILGGNIRKIEDKKNPRIEMEAELL